jgi:hypothetical protein
MSNKFAANIYERFDRRFARDTNATTVTEWVTAHTTLRGRPFSLKDYEFQRAILDDMHPDLSCKKCSQVGLTEVQIRKALAFVKRNRGVSAIFALPEEKLFKKISQTRIDPIIKRDRVFQMEDDEGAVRSVGIKQFGHSFLYVTGATEGDATSTSADALFSDEVDLTDQDMLALFNSRLQNSRYKINQGFSTPSFPGYGIDASFQMSDQMEYLIKCEACNHHNAPRFTREFITIPGLPDHIVDLTDIDATMVDDIDQTGSYVHCEKCHTGLDLGNPSLREWVPAFPNRSSRGYMVTPFATDRLPPAYIVKMLLKFKQRQYMRGFKNTVLGETHTDGTIQLTEAAIRRCFSGEAGLPHIGSDRPLALGIDMGQVCHLVIMDVATRAILSFEPIAVEALEERVKWLYENYRIVCGGIDRHPYTPTANAIRDMTDGKVIPIEYAAKGPTFSLVKEPEDPDQLSHVRANRTNLLDEVATRVRNGMIKFSGYTHWQPTITEHLQGMWRDEKPETPAVWIKLHGRDHFFHAIGYALGSIRFKELEETLSGAESRVSIASSVATFPLPSGILGASPRQTMLGTSVGFIG